MHSILAEPRRAALALAVAGSLLLSGCTSDAPPATQNGNAPDPAAAAATVSDAPVPGLLEPDDQTWTPEALEDLLAPVALYPDDVLGEVLVAATNPQEVLDAGTWRLKNESLEGKALDDAAQQAGFTPPVRVLIQNPVVLDMMCSELGWTQELGQAYVNDQEGVLAAVQRLRTQARDAGTLESSDQMLVETVSEGGERAILLRSPDPDVVYVPQYDPETVYVPVEDDDDGVGTGTVVATALLAFGAGIALGAIFDDDDDDWYDDDYYYPSYYGPPMPYYAHYGYRPVYAGYYPATVYVRPAGYRYAYTNTTIVRRGGDNYWVRYDDRAYVRRGDRVVVSPITKARKNRPELRYLNEKAKRRPARRAPAVDEERGRYAAKRLETAKRAEKQGRARKARRVSDVDRAGGGAKRDRDRADRGGREKGARVDGGAGDRARAKADRGGGGGDRAKARDGGDRRKARGDGGGDRRKAGGGGGGDRRKAGGGGGGDRRKAGGGGGGDRPKARGGGNRGGGGRRRG